MQKERNLEQEKEILQRQIADLAAKKRGLEEFIKRKYSKEKTQIEEGHKHLLQIQGEVQADLKAARTTKEKHLAEVRGFERLQDASEAKLRDWNIRLQRKERSLMEEKKKLDEERKALSALKEDLQERESAVSKIARAVERDRQDLAKRAANIEAQEARIVEQLKDIDDKEADLVKIKAEQDKERKRLDRMTDDVSEGLVALRVEQEKLARDKEKLDKDLKGIVEKKAEAKTFEEAVIDRECQVQIKEELLAIKWQEIERREHNIRELERRRAKK